MESTENSLYALLIGISRDVGEIKSDVKNVQQNVESYNQESIKADEKVTAKLEEAFDFVKKRQDSIKEELEVKIGGVNSELTEKYDGLEKRVESLENKPKDKLFTLATTLKGMFVAALFGAVVTGFVKIVSDVFAAIKSLVQTRGV